MTRPVITPANIRRESTPYKIRRTIIRWLVAVTVIIAGPVVFVHIFDPALNPLIP